MWNIQVDSKDEIKIVRLSGCHHDYALVIGGHAIYLTHGKLRELVEKINGNANSNSSGHANGSK